MTQFHFKNLTDSVRAKMAAEIKADIKDKKIYISSRLNEQGVVEYPKLVLEAAEKGNEISLGENLLVLMNQREFNRGAQKNLPANAEKTLAQNEFNRFYMRAICAEAIEQKIEVVTIYRARESNHPRKRSKALIGTELNAEAFLKDLRKHNDTEPKLLAAINSGLSVGI